MSSRSPSLDPLETPLGRRAWLRWNGLAMAGWNFLGLPKRARSAPSDARTPLGFGRAKSVLVVFVSGGQSQIDTWDPKPDAPREIRGAFDSISTAIPGVRFCEHMPRIAQVADQLCVVRTMAHEDLDHGSAFHLAMTGRYHRQRSSNHPPAATDAPSSGAVLQRVQPTSRFSQTAVHLNGPAEVPLVFGPGQYGGWLGKGFDPLTIGDVSRGDLAIPSFEARPQLSASRLQARQSLLRSIEQSTPPSTRDTQWSDKQTRYDDAFSMLSHDTTSRAFDLSQEPTTLRDRYGRNRSGQACLLGRRLVEAGVPLVTVFWNHNNRGQDDDPNNTDTYGWDNHNDIFEGLQKHLLPRFDQSFSALIEDMHQRGLLSETLVICLGEFGRAPLVAAERNFKGISPGRKHWSSVYSIALAGAGVSRGAVVGESDSRGAYPLTTPFGPWDVTATLFSALGIDPATHYQDALGRPYAISDGKVMEAIYGA